MTTIDATPLLQAIQKKGGYNTTKEAKLSNLEMMRQMTDWTGQVFPEQTTTLRRNFMLITGSMKIVIGLDTEKKTVQYEQLTEPQAEFKYPEDQEKQYLADVVLKVLGAGWTITKVGRGMMQKNASRPTDQGVKPPVQKRVRRSKSRTRKSRK